MQFVDKEYFLLLLLVIPYLLWYFLFREDKSFSFVTHICFF